MYLKLQICSQKLVLVHNVIESYKLKQGPSEDLLGFFKLNCLYEF